MLYLVFPNYDSNTAGSIRFLAFARAFKKMEVDCRIIFLRPRPTYDRLEQSLDLPPVMHLWSGNKDYSNSFLKRLEYIFFFFSSFYHVKKFVSKLAPNDIVYLYNGMDYLHFFLKSKCKVFHERTEHPEVSKASPFNHLNKKYLKLLPKVDGLFVISTALKDYFALLGVPSKKIHILNMVVDASRFSEINKSGKKGRYIAYCGTATNNKDGVDDLIRSFAIVAKEIKDIKLYIIGNAPINEMTGNAKLVADLNIRDRVVFTGRKKSSEIPQLLKDAEVLVLARPDNLQAKYGFPTKLGEYLMTANPVVVTRTSDIPLFLKDGESALLAEPGNCGEISDKIIWALNNKIEANTIGESGKQVAMTSFNSEIEAKKLFKIITEQISNN